MQGVWLLCLLSVGTVAADVETCLASQDSFTDEQFCFLEGSASVAMNWDDGKAFCEAKGGFLAVPTSEEVFAAMSERAQDLSQHLALNGQQENGAAGPAEGWFYHHPDGSKIPTNSADWAPGEPNDSDGVETGSQQVTYVIRSWGLVASGPSILAIPLCMWTLPPQCFHLHHNSSLDPAIEFYNEKTNLSLSQCRELCETHPVCTAFQWEGGVCSLTAEPNPIVRIGNESGIVTGLNNCSQAYTVGNGASCFNAYPATRFVGNAIVLITNISAENECIPYCLKINDCNGIVHSAFYERCWLVNERKVDLLMQSSSFANATLFIKCIEEPCVEVHNDSNLDPGGKMARGN